MDSALVPCPACDRHVRASEAACPFCNAPLPADLAPRPVVLPPRRLGRAAALAFGASLTLAACANEVVTGAAQGGTSGSGGSTVSNGTGGGSGSGGDIGVPLYGGPFPYDSGSPPPPPADGGDAAPPGDGGGDDAGPLDDGGGAPPHDGGYEGGIAPPYGIPIYGSPP